MGAAIELTGLTKCYSGSYAAREISVTIAPGEFFTLLGSSGSGKTTTLMMIAGFVTPDSGDIRIDGRSVRNLPPERRNLGVVFQSYALFPNMNVAQNVSFPLRMRRLPRTEIEKKVRAALEIVDLAPLAERRIGQLSGGQQQRVALARALVFEPPVLLMDEPLGALDRKLREQLQGEIKRIQKALGVTVVYVTHDQDEALMLSNRIAVMSHGAIEQMGTAMELYEKPRTLFVGQFLGESNLFEGEVAECSGSALRVKLEDGSLVGASGLGCALGERVRIFIRPEMVELPTTAAPTSNLLRSRLLSVDYLGSAKRYIFETPCGKMTYRVNRSADISTLQVGSECIVGWKPENASIFRLNEAKPYGN
jgi:ABC-type Fe3+/spermidine/putrescine transport system ATPase subunit